MKFERELIQPLEEGVIRARLQSAERSSNNEIQSREISNGSRRERYRFRRLRMRSRRQNIPTLSEALRNEQRRARLEAEARYHSIQKRPYKKVHSSSRYEAGLTSQVASKLSAVPAAVLSWDMVNSVFSAEFLTFKHVYRRPKYDF